MPAENEGDESMEELRVLEAEEEKVEDMPIRKVEVRHMETKTIVIRSL